MKRSLINEIMSEAGEMIRSFAVTLLQSADWSPQELAAKSEMARALRGARCGCDIIRAVAWVRAAKVLPQKARPA